MLTIIETPKFQKIVLDIFTPEERDELFIYLANNPNAGDVIPNADGARKLRWAAKGKGTRGGARVIYFTLIPQGSILMIAAYAKSEMDNMGNNDIKKAGHYEL
jgi:hypothetical protein